MTPIVLTDEQARAVGQANGPVPVFDSNGKVLGHVEPLGFSPEEIAESKRRTASSEPRYTSEQVQAHFRALEEEWERTGGFDEAYMYAFLDRLRAREGR
jgi:hypothetical protein